jgi:inward rectifier potassium channel
VAKPKVHQLRDMRGQPMIERRGVRVASLGHDAYHFLRTTTWPRLMLLFAAVYLLSNLVFAFAYWATGCKVVNADGFHDLYWFSVQTMATIGYGYLAPASDVANAIVTIESFWGIVLTALVTGLFFARFSTPKARVIFSKVAILGEHDGKRMLMFRMANERATAIVEATVRAYLVRNEKLANGETMRRVYDLTLRRNTSPVFALTFLATHTVDAASPLDGVTAEALAASNASLIVTFTGIDDSLAASVHARHMWTHGEIVFDRRFVDMIRTDEGGKPYIDLAPIHDTEPAPTATA